MGNPVLPVLADYARTILQNSIADPLARGSGLLSMIVSRWAGKEDPAGYGKAAEEEARNLYGYRPKYPETVDALGLMEKTAIGQLSKMPELIQQRTEQINPELGYGGRQIAELAPYFMGLYGGPKAKYFPKYGKFSNMADKMERFEISDKSMKWKGPSKLNLDSSYKLSDLIDHPKLFKQYPEMENIEVYPMVGGTSNFTGSTINLGVTSRGTPLQAKSTLLHEIQHAIQEREGFAKGGSPVLDKMAGNADFEGYKRLAGEIEARDAAARMSLSGQQRRKTAPYTSEDIPLSEWITRRR